MSTVSGILLAAGMSRRMGGLNKLLLEVDGRPLLRRSAEMLLGSRLAELVVVLGHEAMKTRAALQGLDVPVVFNPHYPEGQMSSVHCGLDALTRPADGVMICLADQPLLTAHDIDALIAAFARRRAGAILVPTYYGQRANPIVIDADQREHILRDERNLGCKKLIESNPGLVVTVAMESEHFVFDLDTPDDYTRLQYRLAQLRDERPRVRRNGGA